MAEFTSVRSGSLTHPQMLKPMDPLGQAALIESMESLGKILAGAFLSLYAPPSIPPEILESVRSELSIAYRVLDILVAEVVLQGAGIVAIIGEFEAAGMA
jgi:hypothetical protein